MDFKEIAVEPVSHNIGAYIHELDLSNLDNPCVCDEIKHALWQYQVLFIRNEPINSDLFVKLGSIFGTLEKRPQFEHVNGYPEMQKIISSNGENIGTDIWHTDLSYRERPNLVTLLRAHSLPSQGGDTVWASTRAALQALPEPLRDLLSNLRGVHDLSGNHKFAPAPNNIKQINAEVIHPVIISHPFSQQPSIFVNKLWTVRLLKMDLGISDSILKTIFDWIETPTFTVRFKWEPNSIAIWDNFSTQHYAVRDYGGEYREMHRMLSRPTKPMEWMQ